MTAPTTDPPRVRSAAGQRLRRVGLPVLGLVLLGVCAVLVLWSISDEVGGVGFAIGATLALLPVLPVTWTLLWLDRWEPEPASHLLVAFGWGAAVATLLALTANTAAGGYLLVPLGEQQAFEATAVVVAPIVEEAAKGAVVLGFFLLRRREFDGFTDGIVLAGLSGVGFAFTENILYIGRAFLTGTDELGAAGGIAASVATLVVRGVISPFAHPLFTMATGLGFGLAAMSSGRALRWLAPIGGYVVAVLLHGMWNGSAVAGGVVFLVVYVGIMVPVFATAVGLAVWSRRHQGDVVRRHLPAYAAAGWIAPYEVTLLSSMPLRRSLVAYARRTGGPAGGRATEDYHAAATELAFLRDRMVRGTAGRGAPHRERELLDVLAARRPLAFIPPPA